MRSIKNEKELLRKIKKSDEEAFHTIFIYYHSFLFNHIFYQIHDDTLAQDIVQETFIKVWLKRKFLKPEQSFYAFLVKISNNLVKDHLRKMKSRDKFNQSYQFFNHPRTNDPLLLMEKLDLEKKIQNIINKYLPAKTRTIYILNRVDGKSNDEIAAMLHISKKTIENHLYYALKTLRKKISELI
jgi:RNA polymerase sigma-70 factor (family 1)